MITPELHAHIWDRDHGACIWPHCGQPAREIMHFHSRGMGGTPDGRRDDPSNMGLGCYDHARISDGQIGTGGRAQYRRAHLDLLGQDYIEMPDNRIAYERAEALARLISSPH